ncbi:glycoside hydrolase family 6 protein [Streptomyces sp. NPDC004647]|uniref:glycoside hydrolase family 6 protein n=1 Tax=Streptomyces sp. NPDC004647 TaxID=3154671 RepID=UPI0033B3111B
MDEQGIGIPTSRRSVLVAVSAVLGLLLSGCLAMAEEAHEAGRAAGHARHSPEARETDATVSPVRTDPELWVNPETPAARQVRQWRLQGRTADAESLRRIADQPMAEWIGDSPGDRVRSIMESAARADRTPVLVAYHIPYRDCGNHSAGGANDAAQYRQWIREMAGGIGKRKAIVVMEPDAVAQAVDGCVPEELRAERFALLKDAVTTLSAFPR